MLAFHEGDYIQRGTGIGNFFSGLFRNFVPYAQSFFKSKAGQTVKDIALQAASNVASDVISGKNVKESATESLQKAKKRINTAIKNSLDNLHDKVEKEPLPPPAKKRRGRSKKNQPTFKTKRGVFDLLA